MEKIYVKWIDSGFSLSANIKELLEENKEVETVGFLVAETKDWLVLAQSVNSQSSPEDNLYRGGYFIYKPCIIDRVTFYLEN